jgi:signal transduction histidine kinase
VIRSLRVRFFLLVWPLVVVSLVLLGTLLGRWSRVELRRVSSELRSELQMGQTLDWMVDSLAPIDPADAEALQAAIDRIAASDTSIGSLVVVSPTRGLLATTTEGLQPGDVRIGPGRQVDVSVRRSSGTHTAMMRVIAPGRSLDPAEVADPRLLVMLPNAERQGMPPDTLSFEAVAGTTLSRRIVLALVIGSVIAALVTLVMSGQLTGRVEKLADGVRALGGGDLAARVPVEGGDEIAALASSFNSMAAGLEQSETQRRQMVSDVAHELRTPLTNLIGLVAAARDGLRPANDELLGVLAEEADHLNRLVDDLRDLALSDAGELKLARDAVDVSALVGRVASSFTGNAQNVRVELDAPHGVIALADERRLGQVLRNLVQNAVTHSAHTTTVRIGVTRDAEHVTVEVRDQGPGIPAEHLDRIWERFYRVDPSRARATGGMGLGLSVAKRLVEGMGGSITVESVVGEGTSFRVELPEDGTHR